MRIVIREKNKTTLTAEGQTKYDLLDLAAGTQEGESVHLVTGESTEGPPIIAKVHPILGLVTLVN